VFDSWVCSSTLDFVAGHAFVNLVKRTPQSCANDLTSKEITATANLLECKGTNKFNQSVDWSMNLDRNLRCAQSTEFALVCQEICWRVLVLAFGAAAAVDADVFVTDHDTVPRRLQKFCANKMDHENTSKLATFTWNANLYSSVRFRSPPPIY
jgi:hypothetical protein